MTKDHRKQADEYFAEMEDEINADVLNRLASTASVHLLAAIHDVLLDASTPSKPVELPFEMIDTDTDTDAGVDDPDEALAKVLWGARGSSSSWEEVAPSLRKIYLRMAHEARKHMAEAETEAKIERLNRALVSASESSNQHLEWYENLREDVERRASLDFTPEVTASTLRSILNDDTERRSY